MENLEGRECWDLSKVVRWDEVCKWANHNEHFAHLGDLCELVYLKGSELPVGHTGRKLKGRVVFLGDRVRDQFGAAAVFEELSSSPAGMEASRFCDFYGSVADHIIEQADATQAYTQASLPHGHTYIKLPARYRQECIDKGWIPADDKSLWVVPLDKALYGHPESGAYWQDKCEASIFAAGFERAGTNSEWRSCYYHPKYKVFLMVYVDDFKMSGPPEAVKKVCGCSRRASTRSNSTTQSQWITS